MKVVRLPRLPRGIIPDSDENRYRIDLNRALAEYFRDAPDYKAGVWTPTLISEGGTDPTVTYASTNGASYVKHGRLVTITGRLSVATISGGTGNAVIGGLPYMPSGQDSERGGCAVTFAGGFTTTTTPATLLVSLGALWMRPYRRASADPRDALNVQSTVAEFLAGCNVLFTGTYLAS